MDRGLSATPPVFGDAASAYYARVSYPLRLFARFAEQHHPERRGRLLDLAAGTGRLATGFSPYFDECLLVDASPEMLAKARQRSYAKDCRTDFLCARGEDLQAELGPFDAVAIGRALHHLPRQPTLRALERVTAIDSLIVICEAGVIPNMRNPWLRDYSAVRQKYRNRGARVGDTDPFAYFEDSAFNRLDRIDVAWKREVSIDRLVERAFSYSTSSRAALGPQAVEMETELRQALEPFSEDEKITETCFSYAIVFRRE